jgi:hypothetical protein
VRRLTSKLGRSSRLVEPICKVNTCNPSIPVLSQLGKRYAMCIKAWGSAPSPLASSQSFCGIGYFACLVGPLRRQQSRCAVVTGLPTGTAAGLRYLALPRFVRAPNLCVMILLF